MYIAAANSMGAYINNKQSSGQLSAKMSVKEGEALLANGGAGSDALWAKKSPAFNRLQRDVVTGVHYVISCALPTKITEIPLRTGFLWNVRDSSVNV